MSEHTPGPWIADEGGIIGNVGREEIMVAQTCLSEEFFGVADDEIPPHEERRIAANSRLICAAPDLLRALQRAEMIEINAAIAKATTP